MTMPGGDLDIVVQRLADDEPFAELVRTNPDKALYGYLLTNWDRDRISKIANGIDPDAPELDENGEPIVVVPEKQPRRRRGGTAVPPPPPTAVPPAVPPAVPVPPAPPPAVPTAVPVPPAMPPAVPVPPAAVEPPPLVVPAPTSPVRPARVEPTAVIPVAAEEEGRRRGPLLWLSGAAAVLVILAGLTLGGVFSGGKGSDTSSLNEGPTPLVSTSPTPSETPSPTDSPTSYPTAYPVETPTVTPTTAEPTVAPPPPVTESAAPVVTQSPTPAPSPTAKPTRSAASLPDPVVGAPSASNGNIFEKSCGTPTTSTISARVTDSAGISRVELTWFVNGVNKSGGPKAMSGSGSGSVYQGTLGAFEQSTIGGDTQPIDVTVTATDSGGRQSSTTTQVTLSGC